MLGMFTMLRLRFLLGVMAAATSMPGKRPELTPRLSAKVFGECYWEVKELAAFCRSQGLPASGLKADLTKRVKDFLGGKCPERVSKVTKADRDSVVAGGLKLSTPVQNYNNDAATRSFFQKHCGQDFRFNEYLRSFAKGTQEGLTYRDLVEGWKDAEQKRREGKQEIGKQFEYNQFTRDFFAANPGASRADMMEAWRTVRSYQGPNTYKEFRKLSK
ncbi:unnamed protein product [Effrenium voratum]|uniref:SAP domain-containing protein n=1 Tax=Effrenium voratum TaxID=2562239 RepID=A0AA36JND3_9DINO|nr:unnamed protein product [Effrenium voratum]CAJ1408777.1 unnamed protein product [Effrenium voratum]